MLRCLAVVLFACVPIIALAAPVPKEDDAARMNRMYGTPRNFTKADSFEMAGDKLRVFMGPSDMPKREGVETSNRPRCVWREVKGDFTLTVRVAFVGHPDRSAGLMAWGDSNSASVYHQRNDNSVNFLSSRPNERSLHSVPLKVAPGEVFLRLQRKGRTTTGEYSLDGKEWKRVTACKPKWDDTIKVGLFVENRSEKGSETVFDEYKLTQPQK